MDVQCERCRTEYTLNDAVVSARGTPVRCTTCGHEFKVYRLGSEGGSEKVASASGGQELWVVTASNGQEFRFATFRELQDAILAKRVLREDLLSRDGAADQSLASIAELEALFDRASSSRLDSSPSERRTASSKAPPNVVARHVPSQGSVQDEPPPSPRSAGGTIVGAASVPPRAKIDTLRPPVTGAAAPPPAPSSSPSSHSSRRERPAELAQAPSVPRGTLVGMAAGVPPDVDPPRARASAIERPQPADPLPPPPRTFWRTQMPSEADLHEVRSLSPASDEIYSTAPRRHVGGWVVAVALLGAVGVVGWAAAKPYLMARDAGAAVQLSPRVQTFLADGEKAMADGDLDGAQENFDKASALAEDDARVLLDEARVAAVKADIPWLKLRLLAANAGDDQRTTKVALDELSGRAKRLSIKARSRAPEDAAALRVEIDALRLTGDRESARAGVPKIMVQAAQPETAYVLAALDLAEPEPVWATVIERLRLAAAGEGNAGRAAAALTYALARSGDTAGASAELAKIKTLARPYPLLPNRSAFVEKTSDPKVIPLAAAAASTTAPPTSTLPAVRRAPVTGGAGAVAAGVSGGEALGGDANAAMQIASAAIKKGDFARAGQIYQALVTRNPNDSEALAGLGDVARLSGNPSGAMAAYRRAMSVNPSYLPALLGLADTQWAAGDRASAVHGYSDIVDRFPEGTYPAYVAKRATGDAPVAAPAANAATPGTAAAGAGETTPAPAPNEHAE